MMPMTVTIRTTVQRVPMWLCTEPDCGGLYTTVQEKCVCGGKLVGRDELIPTTPAGVGARIREMLFSLREPSHTEHSEDEGWNSYGTDALRREALDRAGFCWLAPGEMAPQCACKWSLEHPSGPRETLAANRLSDCKTAAAWVKAIDHDCSSCSVKAGVSCKEVGPFNFHVYRYSPEKTFEARLIEETKVTR